MATKSLIECKTCIKMGARVTGHRYGQKCPIEVAFHKVNNTSLTSWTVEDLDESGEKLLTELQRNKASRSVIDAAIQAHMQTMVTPMEITSDNLDGKVVWGENIRNLERDNTIREIAEGNDLGLSDAEIDHIIKSTLQLDSYSSSKILRSPFVDDYTIIDNIESGNSDRIENIFVREDLPEESYQSLASVYDQGLIEERTFKRSLHLAKEIIDEDNIVDLWEYPEAQSALIFAKECPEELFEEFYKTAKAELKTEKQNRTKAVNKAMKEAGVDSEEELSYYNLRGIKGVEGKAIIDVIRTNKLDNKELLKYATSDNYSIRSEAFGADNIEEIILDVLEKDKEKNFSEGNMHPYNNVASQTADNEIITEILKANIEQDERFELGELSSSNREAGQIIQNNNHITSETIESLWDEGYVLPEFITHPNATPKIHQDVFDKALKETMESDANYVNYQTANLVDKSIETSQDAAFIRNVLNSEFKTDYSKRLASQKAQDIGVLPKRPEMDSDDWRTSKTDTFPEGVRAYGGNVYAVIEKVDGNDVIKGYVGGEKSDWSIFDSQGEKVNIDAYELADRNRRWSDDTKMKYERMRKSAYELINPGY